jgi:hypothetical protein
MNFNFHRLGRRGPAPVAFCSLLIAALCCGTARAATVVVAPFTLNTTALVSEQQTHNVQTIADGQFVTYWNGPSSLPSPDETPRYNAVGRIFAIPGGPGQTDEFVSAYQLTSYGNDLDVVATPDGFLLGWGEYETLSYGDSYIRQLNAAALPRTIRFPLSDRPYQHERYPRSAMLPYTGEYLTISRGWDGTDTELYIRKFDSNSLPLTGSLQLTPTDGAFDSRPRIACNHNAVCALVWHRDTSGTGEGNFSSWVQLFNGATFAPIGSAVKVSGDGSVSDGFPSVGIADSGEFVVSWQRSVAPSTLGTLGCYYQRFKASAKPKGAAVTLVSSLCTYPEIVMQADGRWVIANMEQPEGKTDQRIMVREYNADGSRSATTTVAKRAESKGGLGGPTLALDQSQRAALVWVVPASATEGDYAHSLQAAILQLGGGAAKADEEQIPPMRAHAARLPSRSSRGGVAP